MAQLTRSKIAYDLSISPHRVDVDYGEHSLTFVFSSALYMGKFLEKQESHRERISKSLTKRFGVEVKNRVLSDLKLYTTIEKRGFLLLKNGAEIQCLEEVALDGESLIFKSFDA